MDYSTSLEIFEFAQLLDYLEDYWNHPVGQIQSSQRIWVNQISWEISECFYWDLWDTCGELRLLVFYKKKNDPGAKFTTKLLNGFIHQIFGKFP